MSGMCLNEKNFSVLKRKLERSTNIEFSYEAANFIYDIILFDPAVKVKARTVWKRRLKQKIPADTIWVSNNK